MMPDWTNVILLWVLPSLSLLLAFLAAILFSGNLPLFLRWRGGELSPLEEEPSVSVLIPARDEAEGIGACVAAILANTGVVLEVVVLDDGSTDGTGAIVREIANSDSRVRLIEGIALPSGWNGKQHACYRLAGEARYELILFLDADVRLTPTALQQLTRRKAQYAESGPAKDQPIALLSAFPKQQTGTLFEKMLIPLMHYILLGYLPFSRMRASTHPAYAAGCGQLFITDQESYRLAGTHEAIRSSRHDGLMLPKTYRQHGMLTDCVDGTALATCRMYTSAGTVIRGLLKNASEGIANRRLLLPFTVLLGGANLLPYLTGGYAWYHFDQYGDGSSIFAMSASVGAIILSHLPRWVAVCKLRQSMVGAILHPLGILVFLMLQWWAFFNSVRGKQVAWRGRQS